MTIEELKKYALISDWQPCYNRAGHARYIYFVSQITKPNGKKEMIIQRKEIYCLILDDAKNINIEELIIEEAERMLKKIEIGKIKIYSSLYPDKPPKIVKFKTIEMKNKIPEEYKDIIKPFYAT